MALNARRLREDFPCLSQMVDGKAPVYLDNACMTLKPRQVVDAMCGYYNVYPGCAGRSSHTFARKVTEAVESARRSVRAFLNARDVKECVFTRNSTEGINIVAAGLGLKKGDRVLTTDKEHNSNLVPWHMQEERFGVVHEAVRTKDDNTFDMERFESMLARDVRLVAMGHVANLDGVGIPAKDIIRAAHDHGAKVLLDGAQSAPHQKIDVKALDVDFFVFSVHKVLGPTGMGVLYGKFDELKALIPTTMGGETVQETFLDRSLLREPPQRFEGGLQNYAGIVGTEAALKYLQNVGVDNVHDHERDLNRIVTERLAGRDGVSLLGPRDPAKRSGIFSFNIDGIDHHDIGTYLEEQKGIMLRTGMHCVHSYFNSRGLKGSARASMYLYNTEDEMKLLCEGVEELLA